MPNSQEVGDDWTRFRVAPADVERMTGFRFFPALPPEIHDALVARVDDASVRSSSR
jgi:DNA/RNA endonuclease G (NUC1)